MLEFNRAAAISCVLELARHPPLRGTHAVLTRAWPAIQQAGLQQEAAVRLHEADAESRRARR